MFDLAVFSSARRHNLFSFQFTFLMLCLIWSLMRGFYFVFQPIPSVTVESFLPWFVLSFSFVDLLRSHRAAIIGVFLKNLCRFNCLLCMHRCRISVNLEFATISMLVVFYASLCYKSTWKQYHRVRVLSVYAITNILFLFVVLGKLYFCLVLFFRCEFHDREQFVVCFYVHETKSSSRNLWTHHPTRLDLHASSDVGLDRAATVRTGRLSIVGHSFARVHDESNSCRQRTFDQSNSSCVESRVLFRVPVVG
jgi:hypothetical protein